MSMSASRCNQCASNRADRSQIACERLNADLSDGCNALLRIFEYYRYHQKHSWTSQHNLSQVASSGRLHKSWYDLEQTSKY